MQQRFIEAIEKANLDKIAKQKINISIGNRKEKNLHLILKYFFEPNAVYHEQKIGKYYADILVGDKVVEIQTSNFNKLRDKLNYFLNEKQYKVKIVLPIPHIKWLIWIDETTGEISKKRKSSKTFKEYEAFKELYSIKSYLYHSNLSISIVLLEVEEYRLLNGWSKDKKRGSNRYERIPIRLCDIIELNKTSDYKLLVPNNLAEEFTTKDYQKATKTSPKIASLALNILCSLEIIKKIGKKGRAYLYSLN